MSVDLELSEHPVPVVLSAEDVHAYVRSIRDAKSRIAEEIATCEIDRNKLRRELNMVDEHQERVTKEDRERIAFLEGQLQAHLLNLRASDDRIKSIRTPWGDVESRVQQPEYKRDDAVLHEWMADHDFVKARMVTDFDWEGLKKACKVRGNKFVVAAGEFAGEGVPGVEVIERDPKVTVEVTP